MELVIVRVSFLLGTWVMRVKSVSRAGVSEMSQTRIGIIGR